MVQHGKKLRFNHTYAAQTVAEKPKLQFVQLQLDHKDCPLLGSESKLPICFCEVFQGKKKIQHFKGKVCVPTADHSTEHQILEHFQINFG